MTFAKILKRTLVGICVLLGLALAAYVGLQVIGGPMGGLVGAVVYFAAWGIYRLWYLRRKDEADVSKKKIVPKVYVYFQPREDDEEEGGAGE